MKKQRDKKAIEALIKHKKTLLGLSDEDIAGQTGVSVAVVEKFTQGEYNGFLRAIERIKRNLGILGYEWQELLLLEHEAKQTRGK